MIPLNSLSSPITLLTGSGVVSDLHLLVVPMAQCCSNIQRSNAFTAHYCVAIYGCINLSVWDVLPVALHLICDAPPKEDNLNCPIRF